MDTSEGDPSMTTEELQRLLAVSGRSQAWLADKLGVRPNTVGRWASDSTYSLPIPPSRDEAIRALLAPTEDAA